jgi:hypothetical protein
MPIGKLLFDGCNFPITVSPIFFSSLKPRHVYPPKSSKQVQGLLLSEEVMYLLKPALFEVLLNPERVVFDFSTAAKPIVFYGEKVRQESPAASKDQQYFTYCFTDISLDCAMYDADANRSTKRPVEKRKHSHGSAYDIEVFGFSSF